MTRIQHPKYRRQYYNAELKISLTDAMKTYQQTLPVNGKNIKITIPAGIENKQVIKLSGYDALGPSGCPT